MSSKLLSQLAHECPQGSHLMNMIGTPHRTHQLRVFYRQARPEHQVVKGIVLFRCQMHRFTGFENQTAACVKPDLADLNRFNE